MFWDIPHSSALHFFLKCSISVCHYGEAMHGDLPTERLCTGRKAYALGFNFAFCKSVLKLECDKHTTQSTTHFASIDHLTQYISCKF